MEANGYNLSRKWFDFCFDNPDKINTNHTALFMFIIEQWNRFGQKEKFGLPALYCMEVLGIKSKTTYYKTFNDLIEFGFIEIIEKSKNQNTANIIAISKIKSADNSAPMSALDLANIQQVDSTCISGGNIDKQINQLTNKPINNILSKDNEQSSEIVKVDKRVLEIDLIIETIKNLNGGIVDDTVKKQRQYGKLIKDKLEKIQGFNGDYTDFITKMYNYSNEYQRQYFRSLESFYFNIAGIIAGIKTQIQIQQKEKGGVGRV